MALVQLVLFCCVFLRFSSAFLIDTICLSDAEVDSCRTCDSRSERAGKLVMSQKLRNYYHDQIKISIDTGSVKVAERIPNQDVDTGHSCTVTAQARNGKATAKFVSDEEALNSLEWKDYDYIKYRFAKGVLPAEVNLRADIRVWLGIRRPWPLKGCQNIARKTCEVEGKSTGNNEVSITFAASGMDIVSLGGVEHLAFKLNVSVWGEGVKGSWSPVKDLKASGCTLKFLGAKLGSIHGLVRKLGDRFFNGLNSLRELRSDKLIAKLEEELKARMGDEIYVKLCDSSTGSLRYSAPGTHYRKKRATRNCPQTCPGGYSRVGNQPICHRVVMDTSLTGAKAQCSDADNVVFFEHLFGDKNMYRCTVHL